MLRNRRRVINALRRNVKCVEYILYHHSNFNWKSSRFSCDICWSSLNGRSCLIVYLQDHHRESIFKHTCIFMRFNILYWPVSIIFISSFVRSFSPSLSLSFSGVSFYIFLSFYLSNAYPFLLFLKSSQYCPDIIQNSYVCTDFQSSTFHEWMDKWIKPVEY